LGQGYDNLHELDKTMPAEIWKNREVATAFLNERSLMIPDRQRQLEVILRVISFQCPQPRRILDIGSGDAILLATLLETFPDASGVALDFSPLMLEQACQRLAKFGQRATVVEADLQTTAWKASLPEPFNVIVSGFAIHHLPDERKQALYQEIYDLMAEGGVFLNCEHVASATPRGEQMFDDAMATHLYQRRKEKGEEVSLEDIRRASMERPDRAANILALVEDQCCWLREIGLRDVDCFWKYFELAIFGGIK
jgi:tRNA (cmo5U34)-methyltransferase